MSFAARFIHRQKHDSPEELYEKALARDEQLMLRRNQLELTHTNKLARQAELWSIFNLSNDLEDEYYKVSSSVAQIVKEQSAIDEYLHELRVARVVCNRNGDCQAIESMLAVSDPWQEKIRSGKDQDLPTILPGQI
jgi:hypothetical protein